MVVYASWFPLTGWRWPAAGVLLGLLRLPWPRWHDAFDVVANLVGYVPLGALLALVIGHGRGDGARTWLRAVLAASALSYLLEWARGCCRNACLRCSTGCSTVPVRWWVRQSAYGSSALARGAGCNSPASTGSRSTAAPGSPCCCCGRSVCCFRRRWRSVSVMSGAMGEVVHAAASRVAAVAPWLQWLNAGPVHAAAFRRRPSCWPWRWACSAVPPHLQHGATRLGRVWLALGAAVLAFGGTTLSTALNFGPQHAWRGARAAGWPPPRSWRARVVWPRAAGGAWRLRSGEVITAGLAMVAQAPA